MHHLDEFRSTVWICSSCMHLIRLSLDETLAALDHVVHQGKVCYVGTSNFLAYGFN